MHYFANKGLYSQSYGFSSSHVQIWELDNKKGWALKNWCLLTEVLEKTLESPLDRTTLKEISPKYSYWKDWCWSWSSNTLATWCKELIHWKRLWCWERLMGEREGDNRWWNDWVASPTQWTWVWANSGRWWRTGKPVQVKLAPLWSRNKGSQRLVLQSMGLQRVRHDQATEQQWQHQSTCSGN